MSSAFSEEDPKWKCCCGCHVVLGSKIIAGVMIVVTIIGLIASIGGLATVGSAVDTLTDKIKDGVDMTNATKITQEGQEKIDELSGNLGKGVSDIWHTLSVSAATVQIIYDVLTVVAAGLCYYGLEKDKRMFMLPFMILFAFATILSLFTIVGFCLLAWLFYILYCAYQYIGAKESAGYAYQKGENQNL